VIERWEALWKESQKVREIVEREALVTRPVRGRSASVLRAALVLDQASIDSGGGIKALGM